MYEVGDERYHRKILPVVDNFERGLDAVSEGKKKTRSFREWKKVYKQFMTVLEER